jgi:hypothetical protein
MLTEYSCNISLQRFFVAKYVLLINSNFPSSDLYFEYIINSHEFKLSIAALLIISSVRSHDLKVKLVIISHVINPLNAIILQEKRISKKTLKEIFF